MKLYSRSLPHRIIRQHSFLITIIIAIVALFFMLGTPGGIYTPDQIHYVGTAVNMLLTGDRMTISQQDNSADPSLIYWCMSASMKLFGVNEWAARIPSVLAALATVMLTWLMADRWFGRWLALYAGIILLFSPLFFVMARVYNPTMLFTLWITLGLWAWITWQYNGEWYHRITFYLAIGLSFITQGTVGPVLIGAGIVIFSAYIKKNQPLRSAWSLPGLLLAVSIGLIFSLSQYRHSPEITYNMMQDGMFQPAPSDHSHQSHSTWLYIVIMLAGILPWLPIVIHGLLHFRLNNATTGLARTFLLFMVTAFIIMISFDVDTAMYALPTYPMLALFAAAQFRTSSMIQRKSLIKSVHFSFITCLVIATAIVLIEAARYGAMSLCGRDMIPVGIFCLSVYLIYHLKWPGIFKTATVLFTAYVILLFIWTKHESPPLNQHSSPHFSTILKQAAGAINDQYIFVIGDNFPPRW